MVSTRTRCVIWARAAGRCHFPGCNKSLIGDLVANNEDANFGFIAHIVAETPGGPRGDPVLSPQLEDDPNNLMLLCGPHHKLVDVDEKDAYPIQRLHDIKAAHEDRIRTVTDIAADRASHVLRYGAKIGDHDSPVSFSRVRLAMIPERYPAEGRSIGIEIRGNAATDGEAAFWANEPQNLRRQFETHVRARIAAGEINHLSVFALGPIPLLVGLGRLLGDITPAEVYQLHREPAGWKWAKDRDHTCFGVTEPARICSTAALKVGLSATVVDDRITNVLGNDVSIWSLTSDAPNNDVMRYPEDLAEFRRLVRKLYDSIKAAHGENGLIHVFPAIPVSTAVEMGRVWMPKADLPLLIYDQRPGEGFVARLRIDSPPP
jgi:SMODS-associated and fused to various effectors sensor domain